MLTPLQYNHLCDEIAVLYAGLEESVIEDMTRRIVRMGYLSDASAWQARMLQESGMLYEDILAEISQRTGQTDREIRTLFQNAGVQAVRNDNFYYRQAGLVVPRNLSGNALQILEAGYQKCGGSLKNLTLTTANTSQQSFIQACNLAYMQTSSGVMDYNTAIRHAVQTAAGNGSLVRYPSGHTDKLDVAVRRAVLTGVGQTVRQVSFQNARDLDCDLMEITAHAGARPSHSVWQGKIVSLSGRRGYLTVDEIGYGTVDGFGGVSCRHDWHPFFEGFSERAYSDQRLKDLAEHTVQIDEKDYHDYEITQMQLYYERRIREKKRQVLAAKVQQDSAQTDADAAAAGAEFQKRSVQLKKAEQKLKDFLDQTGFLNDSSRTWVDGFGKSISQKSVWANKAYQKSKNPSYGILSDIANKLSGNKKKSYNSVLTNGLKDGKITLEEFFKKLPQLTNHEINDCYNTANPNYKKGIEYKENCQRCIVAYEARRRGYDVIASKAILDDLDRLVYSHGFGGWPYVFGANYEDLVYPDGKTASEVKNDICKRMSKYGDGARIAISVTLANQSRGVFIAEQFDGKTIFIDPQRGQKNVDYFKSGLIAPERTLFLRIDNRDFTDLIAGCIESGE